MGLKWWYLCVVYQTIITTSVATIKLPSPDVESSATSKSSPENALSGLSSPINPKLRKAVLEYFKTKYLGNVDDLSSPAMVTSSSRVLPGPMMETQGMVDDAVSLVSQNSVLPSINPFKSDLRLNSNAYSDSNPFNNLVRLNSLPTGQNIYEKPGSNYVSLPAVNSLPIICLDSLKRNIENFALGTNYLSLNLNPLNDKMYLGGYSTNQLYNLPYPLRYNQISLPEVLTPSDLILSSLNSINNVDGIRLSSPNTLKMGNSYANTYQNPSLQGAYSVFLTQQASPLNSLTAQRVPKVPLVISSSVNYPTQRKTDTRNERILINTGVPLPYLKNYDVSTLNPYYSAVSSYAPLRTLPEPNIPTVNKYGFTTPNVYVTSPSLLNTNFVNNNDYSCDSEVNIDVIIDCDDNIDDYTITITTESDVDDFCNDIPFGKGQVLVPVVVESLPQVCFPPKLPQNIFPATYINTSPTYSLSQSSSKAISSLNDIVSTMTRNILSSFMSYLSTKVPFDYSNPYSAPTVTLDSYQFSPALSLYNTNLVNPNIPQSLTLPVNPYATSYLPFEPLSTVSSVNVMPFYEEIPLTTLNFYSNDLTVSPLDTSSPPLKVTLLPPASFVDYVPLQPCPSTLPLPTIPPSLDVSSPFSTQPQVIQFKPIDRRAKTIERLLEMVFLAEILNGEGYIDWDALDTVLAVLCAN